MTRAKTPLYWRLLRLRRLQPRPAMTFMLFEGSILAGGLLTLADIVSIWGGLAIPVAVAAMVKLNDIVESTLYLRPLARAQLRAGRVTGRSMGVSPVLGAIDPVAPAQPSPAATAGAWRVRAVAAVPGGTGPTGRPDAKTPATEVEPPATEAESSGTNAGSAKTTATSDATAETRETGAQVREADTEAAAGEADRPEREEPAAGRDEGPAGIAPRPVRWDREPAPPPSNAPPERPKRGNEGRFTS